MAVSDDAIGSVESWYHTFELPDGRVTPGFYDLRQVAAAVPIPQSLEGKRCLDAAACEGFWSFEMAKRGASEVVSLDLPDTSKQDWQGTPPRERLEAGTNVAKEHFELVRDALGVDTVTRVDLNLYDVADAGLGNFDYVFVGNILIHLADPARALRSIKSVMAPDAQLLSLETNSLGLSVISPRRPLGQLWDWDYQPRWWTPNRAAHRRILDASGFDVLEQSKLFFQPFGRAIPTRPDGVPRSLRELWYWGWVRRHGVASGWVLGRPRAG